MRFVLHGVSHDCVLADFVLAQVDRAFILSVLHKNLVALLNLVVDGGTVGSAVDEDGLVGTHAELRRHGDGGSSHEGGIFNRLVAHGPELQVLVVEANDAIHIVEAGFDTCHVDAQLVVEGVALDSATSGHRGVLYHGVAAIVVSIDVRGFD